jgi:hypothetical protein
MKFDLKKIFGNKKSGSKKRFSFITFDAKSDWRRLFIIFFILDIFVLGWNAYLFWGVESGTFYQSEQSTLPPPPLPNAHDLSSVRTEYGNKAAEFAVLATSSPSIVDPSR